jgi:uncharacterized membrane protein
MTREIDRKPLIAAGACLGIGMGGFVDGIVFHQILQLHNMLSNRIIPDSLVNEQINMFWDGLFLAFTWIMTALGLILLWRAVKRRDVPLSDRTLAGSMLLGWGLFNLIEGIIDHEILRIHHVVQNGDHFLWEMVFLASGALLILGGWALIRAGRADVGERATRAGRFGTAPDPAHP